MDEARYRQAEAAWWRSLGATPTDRLMILDRPHVQVRLQEVGEGPPVLFLHGVATSGACFADLAVGLPEFRSLLLDRPGCGLSEPLAPPPGVEGLPALADQLVIAVLDALGLERAHLVSTSMGGYFALRAAAAHPDRIGRIVHLGWSLGSPVAHLPLVMRLASARLVSRWMSRTRVTPRVARSVLRRTGMAGAIDRGLVPDEAISWNVALANHTDTRRHEYELARGAPLRRMLTELELPAAELGSVRAPVLVLLGTEDPFGTPATMGALVDRLPDGRLELMQGAGHAVWLDDLDGVAGRIAAFLAEDSTVPPSRPHRTIVLDEEVSAERS